MPAPGAAGTAVQPEPVATDDWKSYEVKESKQDWSSYEVVRREMPAAGQPAQPDTQQAAPSQPAAPHAAQPEAEAVPTDNEVEEALSGLTEMVSERKAAVPPAQQQPSPPKAEAPPAQAAPAKPAAEAVEEDSEASDEGQTWSMEELRKNLTNMDRDG
jgi:hypothetical protein